MDEDKLMDIPETRLSPAIMRIWSQVEIIECLIGMVVLIVAYYLSDTFSWPNWLDWIIIALFAITILEGIWSIFIGPKLKYKYWRYHLTSEFLQLKYGFLKEKNIVVPMTKIQSVATNQGPLLRRRHLHMISVTTMASTHTILV